MSWPYWVLPLLALGGLLWYMLSSGPQQTAPVATSAGKSIYLTTAPDNWASIGGTLNNYVDRGVYNRGGEKLGTIKDILIGPDGKMAAALINVGRSLGHRPQGDCSAVLGAPAGAGSHTPLVSSSMRRRMHCSRPPSSSSAPGRVRAVGIEFLVAQDHFLTPTARYADIVLPATTFWERNDVHTPWAGAGHYAIYMRQAIEPM